MRQIKEPKEIKASPKKKRPGTWEAKGIDLTTGRRKSYYGKSPQEAESLARDSYRVATLPAGIDPKSLYGYYARVYLPTIAHRSQNWQEQVGWAMDKYVLPKFGSARLGDLNRPEFQSFFNDLIGDMKISSIRKIKIVLSCVLNLAEDDEEITKNPVRRVRLPSDETPDKIALTFKQLWTLLVNAQPRAVPIVLLGGFCGLRIGEVCAPTRADIAGHLLKVRHQILQPKGGSKRTSKLKTPQSKRDIPLPPELLDRLLNAGQVSSIYLASNSEGGYVLPKNATRELAEACERAGLGHYEERKFPRSVKKVFVPLISPHELRHTFISLMENELEAPPRIVACLAGRKYGGPNAGYSHTHESQLFRYMARYWERAAAFDKEEARNPGLLELAS